MEYVLHRAATKVPYYRDYWSNQRRQGHKVAPEYLENWPILTKDTLRRIPAAFVADDCSTNKMLRVSTSGTSGKPLTLWRSREMNQRWYAIVEARMRRWHDISRHDRWAIIGGQNIVPPTQQKPPFWVWNRSLNQLYLAANNISKASAPSYLQAIKKFGITHMIVYTSSANYLAQMALEDNIKPDNNLKVILTNAEPLRDDQRATISRAFGCDVRETYGMAENVAAASEDQQGKLRIWPETGYISVVNDESNEPVPNGETGKLVCTNLLNVDMPLIRYDVGDRGQLSTEIPASTDAIQLPIMDSIKGRDNDLLIAPDGRRVFWINPIFYDAPVVEAQVIQESITNIHIRYVPTEAFDKNAQLDIEQKLKERMGNIAITFESMSQLPRTANGKLRAVINNVSSDEIKLVAENKATI